MTLRSLLKKNIKKIRLRFILVDMTLRSWLKKNQTQVHFSRHDTQKLAKKIRHRFILVDMTLRSGEKNRREELGIKQRCGKSIATAYGCRPTERPPHHVLSACSGPV